MSFLAKIFGPAIGDTVKGIGEGVSTLATGIRSAITGELPPEARSRLEELALQGEQLANRSQVEINKIEAGSKSLFVAGWRPFIGWTCGIGLAWNFVAHPILTWILKFANTTAMPPKLDASDIYPIVIGMLGLGAYRSYEKKQGVEHKR